MTWGFSMVLCEVDVVGLLSLVSKSLKVDVDQVNLLVLKCFIALSMSCLMYFFFAQIPLVTPCQEIEW